MLLDPFTLYPPAAGGANPAFVSVSTIVGGAGDTTLNMPAGLTSGDLLVAIVERTAADSDPVPAADWTTYTAMSWKHTGAGADRSSLWVYFHTYAGSDPDLVFLDQAGNHIGGIIAAFSDVAGVAELNSYNGITNQTSHSCPSGTTTTNNGLVLAVSSLGNDLQTPSSVDVANVTLANPTNTYQEQSFGNDGGILFDYATLATAGATGAFTYTTGATRRVVMALIELEAA